jgi:hypothetical protein
MKKQDLRGNICSICGSDKTDYDRNRFHWRHSKNGERICGNCYKSIRYKASRKGKMDKRFIKDIPKDRTCANCNSLHTNLNQWHKISNGFLCVRCYARLIGSPLKNGCYILFKGKAIYFDYSPRTNLCCICNEFYERTNLHHFLYDDNNPLENTIEVCPRCHRMIHCMPVIDLEDEIN